VNKCRQTATELALSSVAELALSSRIQQELIGQLLINQQGFDVDFGEHGLRVAYSWASHQVQK